MTIQLPTPTQYRKMLWPFIAVVVLSVLAGFVVGNWLSVLWLVVGGVIGLLLLFVDEQYLLQYYRADEFDRALITRSPIFLLVFGLLALYVLTSSEQFIGFGVIFGVATGILAEGWGLLQEPQLFLERFTGLLAQPKPLSLTQAQILRIMISATAFVSILYVWWLFGK